MTALRIFAISLNQTPLSWDDNRDNIASALDTARNQGAQIVCLPELCISGYGCEDAFLWPATAEHCLRVLKELLPYTHGMVVAFGLPLWVDTQLYNAAVLVVDGKVVGVYCKKHLARAGIHYEPRWFSAWPKGQVVQHELFGNRVPLGDLIFEVGGVRIAFEICEDAWVKERPAHELSEQNIDLILNPSASHFAFDKYLERKRLVMVGAQATRMGYVYCNLLGNEAGRAIYDGDCLVACGGEYPVILAESRRFSFKPFQMAGAVLRRIAFSDGGAVPKQSSQLVSLKTGSAYFTVVHSFSFSIPRDGTVTEQTAGENVEGLLPKEQAFARAVALALFDYLRKSKSHGFVVSLSGGADSAAVSLLVRLMVRLCWAERGGVETKQLLLGRSDLISAAEIGVMSELELVGRLLTTVYQATKNSSQRTKDAAKYLADALHSRHYEVAVDDLVEAYQNKVEILLDRKLSWSSDDITLQNIQARARAPLVWMLANAQGALLLSTSNRSEAAVGYATMDGDTAGGLSPIAGIDKSFLRSWLLFMQHTGIVEMGPLTALSFINEQEPTAELRPTTSRQTDESDLMPYEVLDLIEREALYRRHPPLQVLSTVMNQFQCNRISALNWLQRFYHLFSINQWKRERYAPSFFVDEGNLDPKTWLRFPILSGGFEYEMRQLETTGVEE